ncbi:MAG: hypothetical protein AAGH88_00570 [Planctomycetota bacterium]
MTWFDVSSSIFGAAVHMGGVLSHIPDRTSNMFGLLAYRPFLDPAPIDRYWLWLLPPLIVIVAVVYRVIKTDDLRRLPGSAGYLAFQIALFMIVASVGLYIILRLG